VKSEFYINSGFLSPVIKMPGAGVVAGKVRKQRAVAQSLKDNKEGDGDGEAMRQEVKVLQLASNPHLAKIRLNLVTFLAETNF
jgi:hypothetical protein